MMNKTVVGIRIGILCILILGSLERVSAVSMRVVFDPGHGFDTTLGLYTGAPTAIEDVFEDHFNLKVALTIDTVMSAFPFFYDKNEDYFFTRESEIDVLYFDRVTLANQLNFGTAEEFVSIHHNSGPPTANRTETFYCDRDTTDSGIIDEYGSIRDTTSLLARKVGMRLADALNLNFETGPWCTGPPPCSRCGLYVLRNTIMSSVLTEALFITNPAEADSLWFGTRSHDEAEGIAYGLQSYVDNGGFAIVVTAYNDDETGIVTIDEVERTSPFESVWLIFENHDLSVTQNQWFPDGYQRSFYRWVQYPDWQNRRDTVSLTPWYDPEFPITVGIEQEYHYFIAYYQGGPYNTAVSKPADTVFINDTIPIPWSADAGADSTTVVHIQLDRSGGAGGYSESMLNSPDYFDEVQGYNWIVNGPATDNARFRLDAYDYAGNSSTSYSDEFVIFDCGQLDVTNQQLTSNHPTITRLYLDYSCSRDHLLEVNVFRWEDDDWEWIDEIVRDTLEGDYVVEWEIDSAHHGQYDTYRMAGECILSCGTGGPVLRDSIDVEVTIENTDPMILQALFIEGGLNCLVYGTIHECHLVADDLEDGQMLTYTWQTVNGTFDGGVKTIVTQFPDVKYYAPDEPAEGCNTKDVTAPPDDRVFVTVTDQGGAQSSWQRSINLECINECPTQPSCDCSFHGDAAPQFAGDGVIDVFDVVLVSGAVFQGGAPPLWIVTCPASRGDVTEYGELTVLDVVLLADVAFRGAANPPDPCSQ